MHSWKYYTAKCLACSTIAADLNWNVRGKSIITGTQQLCKHLNSPGEKTTDFDHIKDIQRSLPPLRNVSDLLFFVFISSNNNRRQSVAHKAQNHIQ